MTSRRSFLLSFSLILCFPNSILSREKLLWCSRWRPERHKKKLASRFSSWLHELQSGQIRLPSRRISYQKLCVNVSQMVVLFFVRMFCSYWLVSRFWIFTVLGNLLVLLSPPTRELTSKKKKTSDFRISLSPKNPVRKKLTSVRLFQNEFQEYK